MKKIIVLLIANMFFSGLFSQKINKIDINVSQGGYGKLYDGKLAFIGFESSIDSMRIYCHSLDGSYADKVLIDNVYFPPIGWVNNHVILLFKKSNKGNSIYQFDINSNEMEKVVSVDSVFQPELYIANDDDKIIYTYHYLRSKEQKTFIYDYTTRKTTLITQLQGRNIRRISYNKRDNIVAFIELEQREKYLSIFHSGKIEKLFKYEKSNSVDESPITFNDDGSLLFYVKTDASEVALFKYDFNLNASSKICSWEQGVKCIDLSYSSERLLITMDGLDEKKILKSYSGLKHDYKFELEAGLCMFVLDL